MSLDSASPRTDLEKGNTHGGRFQLDTKDDIEISDPKSGRGERRASHLSTKAGAQFRASDPGNNEEVEAASGNKQTLYVCDYFELNSPRKVG